MQIAIHHPEDVRFSATCGEHEVAIDLPLSHGGSNAGMTPPQLFVAALGGCAGVYVADYCDSQGIDYRGMRLMLDWQTVERPRRIGGVRLRLELPCELTPEQHAGLRSSVQQCLLHNTLAQKPAFDIDVVATEAVAPAAMAAARCDDGACCRAPA